MKMNQLDEMLENTLCRNYCENDIDDYIHYIESDRKFIVDYLTTHNELNMAVNIDEELQLLILFLQERSGK